MLLLDKMLIGAKIRWQRALRTSVKGDSHFLAIAVACIIVIVIGSAFKDVILDFITSIGAKTKQEALNLF